MYIYLYLNLFVIFLPLVLSFNKQMAFYRNWLYLFPAITVNALLFIIWNSFFTHLGVWGINPEYLSGIYLFGLPLEEILFIITVPYTCVFIYETLNAYILKDFFRPYAPGLSIALFIVLVSLGLFFLPGLYTFVTLPALTALQLLHNRLLKNQVSGRFYVAFFVHLIPFLLVNGVLTALRVGWYNNDYDLGVQLGTSPKEEAMYSMPLLLLAISVYELLWCRKQKQKNALVV